MLLCCIAVVQLCKVDIQFIRCNLCAMLQLGAQFQEFAKGLSGLAKGVADGNSSVALAMKIERLAEEIASWIDTQSIPKVRRQLPPAGAAQTR